MLAHTRCRPAPVVRAGPTSLALACVLAACAPRPAERAPAPRPAQPQQVEPPAGARVYDIDPDRSRVTILVRRAGPLARLGHNHVVTSGRESGLAWLGEDLGHSGFELHLPVADLVVDEPSARAAAGAEFGGEVPADAREGTHRNMLRPEVLDGARHPLIVVRSSGFGGSGVQPVANAIVGIRAITRALAIPVKFERNAREVTARGSLRLRQSDFGIVPFSVGGGAIQVADELQVEFEIHAIARGRP